MTNALMNEAQAAGQIEDHSVVQKGFTRETAPAGLTKARLIGYIEYGDQKQRPYQGQPKDDAPMAMLVFELLGKRHITEYEKDGVKKKRANIHIERIKISNNEKSGFFKLFNLMRNGRSDIKNMAQMLGEAFMLTVVHVKKEKEGKEVTYVNIKDTNGYKVGPPVLFNPETEETSIVDVPQQIGKSQLLLWKAPSQAQWDSIFIDGTYTRGEGDKAKEVSKNWIQNAACEATNFVGSALESLIGERLSGLGEDISSLSSGPETLDNTAEEPAPTGPSEGDTPDTPSEPAAESKAPDDVLGNLGLAP